MQMQNDTHQDIRPYAPDYVLDALAGDDPEAARQALARWCDRLVVRERRPARPSTHRQALIDLARELHDALRAITDPEVAP